MNKKNNYYINLIFTLVLFLFLVTIFVSCSEKDEKKECKDDKHNGEWIITEEATCTTPGSKNLVCKDCDKVITTAKIDSFGHNIVIDEKVDPSCEKDGLSEGSHCSVCNEIIIKQEIIPATDHHYILDTDLSNDLVLVYKCSVCEKTKEEVNNTVCTNHQKSEWIVTKEATCSETGLMSIVCLNCNLPLEYKVIPLANHTEEKIEAVKPTCDKDGLSEGIKCSVCSKIIKEQEIVKSLGHQYELTDSLNPTESSEGYLEYTCSVCDDSYRQVLENLNSYNPEMATVIVLKDNNIIVSNNNGGVIIDNNCVIINLAGEYDLSGKLTEGSVKVAAGEEDKIILNLKGVEITSSITDPIFIENAGKVEISAKSDTVNIINDKRTITDDATGACIYSKVDLELKGKGELHLDSSYNNGVGSTKDLEIKNLTLNINAVNNAIKGNDSISIESGTIKAISSTGDGLKTENSDISDKGNQRGIITINDGVIDIYAACDGIDAAYDCIINGGTINIYTEKFSQYSGDVTVTTPDIIYIRVSSRTNIQSSAYKYSAKFTDEEGNVTWVNGVKQNNQSRYFELKKPEGAKYITIYCYNAQQTVGQDESFMYSSDQLTIPSTFDEYYITSTNSSSKSLIGNWQNYGTQSGPGGRPGGGGGFMEGNNNKADYSCKGIKADNSITINDGNIYIKSHDDAIHTNVDVLLQTNKYGIASLTINGGNIKVYSDDDGLHADGTLLITGGDIVIENSYEGVEGNIITLKAGTIQIKSLDDGINGKSKLEFLGANVYLDAGGDGIDCNNAITMTAGVVLAQGPSNGGNGVIDFDRTFTISGGLLLAVGCNGMNQKPTAQSGATSTSKSISTNTNSYVSVKVNNETVAVIKITKSSQTYCVLAYGNSEYPNAQVSTSTQNSYDLVNGLYYIK